MVCFVQNKSTKLNQTKFTINARLNVKEKFVVGPLVTVTILFVIPRRSSWNPSVKSGIISGRIKGNGVRNCLDPFPS
jgi:hypothetical protein